MFSALTQSQTSGRPVQAQNSRPVVNSTLRIPEPWCRGRTCSVAISRSEQPCKGGSASRATRINPSIPTGVSETQKTLSVRDLLETGRGELFQSTTSSSRCETSFFCRRFTGASDARTVHSTPSTNGLVGHDNTALKQHFLNVAQGQIEAKLQSDMPLSQSNGIKHETGGLWWIVARSSLRQARMGQAVLTAVSRWHHWQ